MAKSKRRARTAAPPDLRVTVAPPRFANLTWPRDALLTVGLVLMIAVAYWPVSRNVFTNFDDDDYVVDNEFVNQGLSLNNLAWAMTSFDRANWHPLTWISHMLDCQLFGLQPAGHHLTSLVLHGVNSVLLYYVLLRMTGAVWPSLTVATLFAVHPLHVESVAWVAERKDVLSTLFGLIALAAWLKYLSRPGLVRYAAVMLWFAASLMSKSMWVTFPFLLLLLDFWPLGRSLLPPRGYPATIVPQPAEEHRTLRTTQSAFIPVVDARVATLNMRRLVLEKLPLMLMSLASCFVTYQVQSRGKAVVPLSQFSIAKRLATAAEGYCSYLWRMAVPLDLAPIYPLAKSVNYPAAIACGAAIAVFTALVVWAARKRKYLAAGWFWYVGTLVPVIGIVQVGLQATADRYTYLPSVGIFILFTWSASELVTRWPGLKPLLAAAAAAVLAWFCVLTSVQVRLWASTEALFTHAVAVTQDNSIALTNLGLVAIHEEDYAKAERLLREALRIDSGNIDALGNLASMYVNQKKYDDALKTYGLMLRHGLSSDKAVKAYALMARACEFQGNHAAAESLRSKAVEIQPASAVLRYGLGLSQQLQGKTELALENYAVALRIKPGEKGTTNNIAWIYSTHPNERYRNGDAAIALLEPLAARPDCDANLLDTLAAAYAAAGRFHEAVQTIEIAIDRARGEKNPPESIADMGRREALYKKNLPYRDPALLGPAPLGTAPPHDAPGKK
jgi:protein O-mannosyl-transferase